MNEKKKNGVSGEVQKGPEKAEVAETRLGRMTKRSWGSPIFFCYSFSEHLLGMAYVPSPERRDLEWTTHVIVR